MPEFTITEVAARPYIYVDRLTSMDPAEISAAMDDAYTTITAAMQAVGIEPEGPPVAVYYDYDPGKLSFRAGVFVSAADAARVGAPVKSDETPAGRMLRFVHKGPYATLRVSYGEMMRYMEDRGLKLGVPSWEVYLNDPDRVPEAELLTEVYCMLG